MSSRMLRALGLSEDRTIEENWITAYSDLKKNMYSVYQVKPEAHASTHVSIDKESRLIPYAHDLHCEYAANQCDLYALQVLALYVKLEAMGYGELDICAGIHWSKAGKVRVCFHY